MKKIHTIFVKIDDFREEKLEVFLANCLKKYDSFNDKYEIRIAINKAIIDAVLGYAQAEGLQVEKIPNEAKVKIAEEGAKIEKKLNNFLQKQLRKTSKKYQERHEDDKL